MIWVKFAKEGISTPWHLKIPNPVTGDEYDVSFWTSHLPCSSPEIEVSLTTGTLNLNLNVG